MPTVAHPAASKERKKARREQPTQKFLGGVLKDMELVKEIDWKVRRQEILDRLEKEERERVEKIEKAQKLQKTWELNIECRRLLKEFNTNWTSLEDKIENKKEKEKRDLQIEKAKDKKKQFKE